jgi:hypothetical protein
MTRRCCICAAYLLFWCLEHRLRLPPARLVVRIAKTGDIGELIETTSHSHMATSGIPYSPTAPENDRHGPTLSISGHFIPDALGHGSSGCRKCAFCCLPRIGHRQPQSGGILFSTGNAFLHSKLAGCAGDRVDASSASLVRRHILGQLLLWEAERCLLSHHDFSPALFLLDSSAALRPTGGVVDPPQHAVHRSYWAALRVSACLQKHDIPYQKV